MAISIKKILCATDLSDYSKRILRYGTDLATRFDAELLIFHTLFEAHDPIHNTTMFHRGAKISKKRDAISAQIEELMSGATCRWEPYIATGEPVEELLKAAEMWRPKLVLAASHGLSGFKRIFLGTVIERMVRKLELPILVVRSSKKGNMEENGNGFEAKKITVCCDILNDPIEIVDCAAEFGLAFNSTLHLLHVVERPMNEKLVEPTQASYPEVQRILQERLHQRLHSLVLEIIKDRCMWKTKLLPGTPGEVLPRYIKKTQMDLVVVGIRHRSKFGKLLLGSTTESILRGASCSVLAIPV
jgi:nucleotide-binding universal stress UspA family protein